MCTSTVLTVGHSTRTWKVFLDLLRAHRVERVIDVRSIPRSRHNPQFNQETLRRKLRCLVIPAEKYRMRARSWRSGTELAPDEGSPPLEEGKSGYLLTGRQ